MEKLQPRKPELAVSIPCSYVIIADLSKLFYRDRTLLGRCILLEKMWEDKVVIFSSERLTIKPEDAAVSLVRKLIHSVRFSRAWIHAPVSASQRRAILSPEADASRRPLGQKATESTQSACPWSV